MTRRTGLVGCTPLVIVAILCGSEARARAGPVGIHESLGLSVVKVTSLDRSYYASTWHADIGMGFDASRWVNVGIGFSYDQTGLTIRRPGGEKNETFRAADPAVRARLYPSLRSPAFVEAELGGRFLWLPDTKQTVAGFLGATTIGFERGWARRGTFGALVRMAYVPSLTAGGTSFSITFALRVGVWP